jgi:hypothetical protein
VETLKLKPWAIKDHNNKYTFRETLEEYDATFGEIFIFILVLFEMTNQFVQREKTKIQSKQEKEESESENSVQ